MYWEAARFAPMIPFMRRNGKKKLRDVKYIVLTREDRFDLYGKYVDILVPLKIPGDYTKLRPDCFRLWGLKNDLYTKIIDSFVKKYEERFSIAQQIRPKLAKRQFGNKNQFVQSKMIFEYKPRAENYKLIKENIPNDKPIVILAPRFRKGFKRNWSKWPDFYDLLYRDKELSENFTFVICGKKEEYIGDADNRFYDITNIRTGKGSSLIGLVLVLLKHAVFTFGSQSAIPNLSLLHGVEVLEFGCQKALHTRTYNIKNTPVTFIDNKKYDIEPKKIIKELKNLLRKKRRK
ncbi:MAG: hypothetical protein PVG65_01170 [Candidatus Thorarchaeota archaeon]